MDIEGHVLLKVALVLYTNASFEPVQLSTCAGHVDGQLDSSKESTSNKAWTQPVVVRGRGTYRPYPRIVKTRHSKLAKEKSTKHFTSLNVKRCVCLVEHSYTVARMSKHSDTQNARIVETQSILASSAL